MAVIRVNKTKDFTVMSNAHFKEREMSLKAKGLLSLMLSLPDEWDYSISGLVAICKENEAAVKSTLSELKKLGYLSITKLLPNETNSGRIEYVYNIFEHPQKQEGEKQGVENQPLEKQGVEIQAVENPTQLNTNSLNTEESKTDELSIADIVTEFETLWKLYPNKQGKAKALIAYKKARKNGVSYETVKQGIENYNGEIKAKKTAMEFIKHGSTWFNGECWNDEYGSKPTNQFAQLKGGLTV